MNTNIHEWICRLEALEARCEQADARYRRAERRIKGQTGLALVVVLCALLVSPGSRAAIAQSYGTTLQQLLNRVVAVETKTQFMSADATAKTTTFTGCNVYIQNGMGVTNGNPVFPYSIFDGKVNGLGNLIIGYNLPGRSDSDQRTGSHNLILGDLHNYTSYSALIAGYYNASYGPFASVYGGAFNIASGAYSCISGGLYNGTSGLYSSVAGGQYNTAAGETSAVSGGLGNAENALWGWAGGGYHTP